MEIGNPPDGPERLFPICMVAGLVIVFGGLGLGTYLENQYIDFGGVGLGFAVMFVGMFSLSLPD